MAGVCRTKLSGTVKSILGRGEHRWDRIGAVYASDVCQFRDTKVEYGGSRRIGGMDRLKLHISILFVIYEFLPTSADELGRQRHLRILDPIFV